AFDVDVRQSDTTIDPAGVTADEQVRQRAGGAELAQVAVDVDGVEHRTVALGADELDVAFDDGVAQGRAVEVELAEADPTAAILCVGQSIPQSRSGLAFDGMV